MNKLTALYGVMKNLREMRIEQKMNGAMQSELLLGEEVIASANGQLICNTETCSRKFEMNLLGEEVSFSHKGSGMHKHCHSHIDGIHTHGHHGINGRTFKGRKYTKAMLMLKLLDRLEYQSLEDGRGLLSLQMTLEDLPEELREACCCCCTGSIPPHMQAYLCKGSLADLDLQSLTPGPLSVKLVITEDARPLNLNVLQVIHVKDLEGEAKELHFKFNGDLL